MTRFLLLMAACAAAPLIAWSQSGVDLKLSSAAVRKDVIAVIDAQLAALRAGDVEKAYGYATAALRTQTPLPAFTAIVQTNYPELWTNTAAEYGLVRDDGRHAILVVEVSSRSGSAVYEYVLLKERRGWRIGSIVRQAGNRRSDV